ncbi:MAG TPA: tetratricopeptide repeat protein [Bryobacteraceae bacterium]
MRYSRTFVALSGLAFGLALSVSHAAAQGRGGQGTQPGAGSTGGMGNTGGNTPGNTGNTGNTGSTTTPNVPGTPTRPGQERQPQFESMQRTYFVSGKVLMEDGTPPPETVVIERTCGGGMRKPEGYTDSKGRFSFQLGQNPGMLAEDAGVGSQMDPLGNSNSPFGTSGRSRSGSGMGGNDPRLMGCELRAVLAGYRSEAVDLSGRRALDSPDVGTIILRRLGNVEGTTISATSVAAPKDAKKAYDKGVSAVKKQKWPEAEAQFQKAVEIYPKYAAAWNELGNVYYRQKNPAEARKAYNAALAADPKYLKPYRSLAAIATDEKNWQEVADTTGKLLRLDPVDFPDALLTNAIANVNLRKIDEAEKSAREAVKLDTSHQFPRAEYVLGVILANKQDYSGALQFMRSYLQRMPNAPDSEGVRQQIARLEKAAGGQPGAEAAPAAKP